MPLVNGFDLIDIIKDRHVVAGAFNTTNLETTMGILRAVEKSGIPAFIQIAPTNIPVSGYGFIKDLGSGEKYFFHVSNNTLTDISETDIVTFELERGLRGMNAINIRIESESSN